MFKGIGSRFTLYDWVKRFGSFKVSKGCIAGPGQGSAGGMKHEFLLRPRLKSIFHFSKVTEKQTLWRGVLTWCA